MTIEVYNRKARFAELRPYDAFADASSFMEVCEWHNGEGFDVTIDNRQFPSYLGSMGMPAGSGKL
jgi:hypothetical protein